MKSLLFSSAGRINRSRFWLGVLILIPIFLVVRVALLVMYATVLTNLLSTILILEAVCLVVFAWMFFSLSTKRWHDMNKSGNWNFLVLIPLAGWLWMLLELGIVSGTDGPNRYGEKP